MYSVNEQSKQYIGDEGGMSESEASTSQQKHYDIVLKKKEARLELLRNPRKYRHFNKVQGVFTSERFYDCPVAQTAQFGLPTTLVSDNGPLPGSKKLLLFQVSISRHDAIIRLSHSYAHHKLKDPTVSPIRLHGNVTRINSESVTLTLLKAMLW